MQRQKSSVMYKGFRLVRLHDRCVREAIRFFSDGRLTAIIQKNGNISINFTGIFDDEASPNNQYRVAQCLYGLKLVATEFLEAHAKRANAVEHKRDVRYLADEAERLGFKITPLKSAKVTAP